MKKNLVETAERTIVAFHIGRGGHFHNAGHKTYIGEHPIGKFTDDLFTNFENQQEFKDRFGFDTTNGDEQKCILDLISDENFDELEEKFGITEAMLGEKEYSTGVGNRVGLTAKEVESGIGRIRIDMDYDTTYTCYLSDCDENELKIILDSHDFLFLNEDAKDYVREYLND